MKKAIVAVLCFALGLSIAYHRAVKPEKVIEGNIRSYSELSDGTWECEGNTYKYKLEITGRMNNASADSTFVYLSNLEEITFEQAWKAAGFSSNTNDYFSVKDAVIVEIITA